MFGDRVAANIAALGRLEHKYDQDTGRLEQLDDKLETAVERGTENGSEKGSRNGTGRHRRSARIAVKYAASP